MLWKRPAPGAPSVPPAAAAVAAPGALDPAIASALREQLASYRKIIVLLANDAALPAAHREQATRVGQVLFHDNQERSAALERKLGALVASNAAHRYDTVAGLLDFIESDAGLYDADRLAFRELLQGLLDAVARDSSLPAIKVHKRISDDLDALAEIEHNYEKEIRQIFGRYEQRGI